MDDTTLMDRLVCAICIISDGWMRVRRWSRVDGMHDTTLMDRCYYLNTPTDGVVGGRGLWLLQPLRGPGDEAPDGRVRCAGVIVFGEGEASCLMVVPLFCR